MPVLVPVHVLVLVPVPMFVPVPRARAGAVAAVAPMLFNPPCVLRSTLLKRSRGSTLHVHVGQGFEAAKGWDPVTGLGVANYTKMAAAVMALR